jgi:hypothetical protein
VSFERYIKPQEIIVEPGNKIDLYEQSTKKWVPAVIDQVEVKNEKRSVLKVKIEESKISLNTSEYRVNP